MSPGRVKLEFHFPKDAYGNLSYLRKYNSHDSIHHRFIYKTVVLDFYVEVKYDRTAANHEPTQISSSSEKKDATPSAILNLELLVLSVFRLVFLDRIDRTRLFYLSIVINNAC